MTEPVSTRLLPTIAQDDLARRFTSVSEWIFDLDNTLYPPHTDLFAQVDQRITDYIAGYLKVDRDEAYRIQKDYYRRYGTSLRGLMAEHGMNPNDFLVYVHDIDHSPLEPDPALGAVLAALPGRKFVLTNGSRGHAEAVTGKLGIDHHFEDMFGIVEADFTPKPASRPYDTLIARYGIDPTVSTMFEDIARNLAVPKQMGMTTILVTDDALSNSDWRGDWENSDRDAPHIDHVTTDIAAFLVDICEALKIDMSHSELPHRENGYTTSD